MKLAAKLAQIMGKIEDRIPKHGWNDFHKYEYVTEADIADHMRGILAEHNVAFLASVEEASDLGNNITRLRIKFSFIDGDSDERLDFYGFGDGQDKGDKGIYKAFTGAAKYALMKTFLIATGDDPEDDSKASGRGKPDKPPKAPEQPKSAPATKGNPTMANDKQLGLMRLLASKAGKTADEMKALISERYRKDSSKLLTSKEVSDLIDLLQALPAIEPQGGGSPDSSADEPPPPLPPDEPGLPLDGWTCNTWAEKLLIDAGMNDIGLYTRKIRQYYAIQGITSQAEVDKAIHEDVKANPGGWKQNVEMVRV